MDKLYEGPWRIIEPSTLEERPRLKMGEIMRHRSGAVLFRCPKCNALQFSHVGISGNDGFPTLSKGVQCGAGMCKKCAIWFTVKSGTTVLSNQPEEKEPRPMPDKLTDAGVHRQPNLEDSIAKQKVDAGKMKRQRWTREELERYSKTGKLPNHAKGLR